MKELKKEQRVKKNREFQEIFNKGESFANRQFVIYKLQTQGEDPYRLGLSVSKKIGNAVVRNRIKRYIRQSFLELKDEIKPGYDYVIIARKPAADFTFFETKSSLTHVMKRADVLKRKEKRS